MIILMMMVLTDVVCMCVGIQVYEILNIYGLVDVCVSWLNLHSFFFFFWCSFKINILMYRFCGALEFSAQLLKFLVWRGKSICVSLFPLTILKTKIFY